MGDTEPFSKTRNTLHKTKHTKSSIISYELRLN